MVDAQTNQALQKLSPERVLSPEQQALCTTVVRFCQDHIVHGNAVFVIEGDAGTGKSIVINKIFNEIQKLSREKINRTPLSGTKNYLLVNHPEMMKLYRNISEKSDYVKKKDYERPTTFINAMHKTGQMADIVLVDEAHLLLTKSDKYNRFAQDNHLEEILKCARVVVLVFDDKQVLKFKSHWTKSALASVLAQKYVQTCQLKKQFRMHASAETCLWIEEFCRKNVSPIPKDPCFDIRFFEDAQAMYDLVRRKNAEFGLSRMVATYDYPYRLDGKEHFVTEGRFHLRWDMAKPEARLPWAERADTIDEVGAVYTVQGFDLNYVGLLIGPSVRYDAAARTLVLDPTRYEDGAAFAGRNGFAQPEQTMERIMLNAINVLMTRAVRGLYIYAHDPALRARLAGLPVGF
ncbi:DUF2075 domain-containing protein [Acetobacter sp. LMG 32666]|uniref:DUF2075 domain-containing protein n=1 Tax=Acetobacter sp. LMG 32666 TaxID=2959295 RepID=UPI0030C7EF7D